jgi:hypothetical protein
MAVMIDRGALSLGDHLSVRSAERVLREWGRVAESRPILVDLSELRFVEIGAGWRLGNAISAWSRQADVTVRVPAPGNFAGPWYKTFTKSGLGLAMAVHDVKIDSGGQDITEEVRRYYEELGPATASTTNVVVAGLERRVELRDPDLFATEFSSWAPWVGLEWVDSASKAMRISFLSMIREAVANVFDHAYKPPCEQLGSKLNYLSLRRYERLTTAPGEGSMERYLESIQDDKESEQTGWIEVVVVDDGVGIAARHSQNPNVCDEDLSTEDEMLGSALTSGASVKRRTCDAPAQGDPGYGFTYMADGLWRFRAYAELRTGRRLLTLDASGPSCDGFVIREQELGWMTGTALHVVFPLYSAQLRIRL